LAIVYKDIKIFIDDLLDIFQALVARLTELVY